MTGRSNSFTQPRTVAFLSSCILFGFAVCQLNVAAAGILPDVELKTTFPSEVHVDLMPPVKDKGFVTQKFHVTMKNNSGKDIALFASSPCTTSDWHILDNSGASNQGKNPGTCTQVTQTSVLKAGATLEQDDTAHIDGKLLSDGASYKFRYKFWGYETESAFKAIITH